MNCIPKRKRRRETQKIVEIGHIQRDGENKFPLRRKKNRSPLRAVYKGRQ